LNGKDGLLLSMSHNPKVAGSNPAPATNIFNKLEPLHKWL
jgi:hypothetical protein